MLILHWFNCNLITLLKTKFFFGHQILALRDIAMPRSLKFRWSVRGNCGVGSLCCHKPQVAATNEEKVG